MIHKKILHGLDGSPGSLRALEEALDLASLWGVELHTISVEETPHYPGTVGEVVEAKETANSRFKAAVEQARELGRERGLEIHPHVFVGHEVRTTIEFIKQQGFNLLVIGFMGHSAVYDRVMGSTCQSLVRMAPCSVWVVK